MTPTLFLLLLQLVSMCFKVVPSIAQSRQYTSEILAVQLWRGAASTMLHLSDLVALGHHFHDKRGARIGPNST